MSEQNTLEENKALIRRWFEEVWNKGRADAIGEMLAEDAVVHGLSDDAAKPLRGPEGFLPFHAQFREAFPGMEVVVEDTIAEGDLVAVRCSVRGKHVGDSVFDDDLYAGKRLAKLRMKRQKACRATQGFGGVFR